MKKVNIRTIVSLLTVLLVVLVITVVYFGRLPKKYYIGDVRTIEEIHKSISSNKNLLFVIADDNETYYDIDGNCYLGKDNFHYSSGGVLVIGDDFGPSDCGTEIIDMGQNRNGKFILKDSGRVKIYIYIFLQEPYKIIYPVVENYYTISNFNDISDNYRDSHVKNYSGEGSCEYYPYNVWSTTCRGDELKEAESIYLDFKELLNEFGIAEEELTMYIEWYIQQVDSKVIQ